MEQIYLPERTYLTDRPYQKLRERAVRNLTIAELNRIRATQEYRGMLIKPNPKRLEAILKTRFKAPIKRAAWFNRSLRVCMAEDHIELQEEIPELTKIFGTQALLNYQESLRRYEREQRRKKTKWEKDNAEIAEQLQTEITRIITDQIGYGELLQRMREKTYFEAVVEYLTEKNEDKQSALNTIGKGIHGALNNMIETIGRK